MIDDIDDDRSRPAAAYLTPANDLMSLSKPNAATSDMAERLGEISARLDVLTDLMPQMVWSTLPDGYHDFYNARWYEFTGVPPGSTDGEAWNGMFHPEDQERAWARWRHSLDTGEPYEIEYRLRHRSGAYRWVLGRALPVRNREGRIVRWIGTCTDIHEAKLAAEQNELLSRELSHRIKNIFAVIGGLIALSPRAGPDAVAFATELQGRISALAKAHEFVRPHSEQSAVLIGETTLLKMIADVLSPYPAMADGRITLSGDDVQVDDRSATPISLVFHELATNAAKYGALLTAQGSVAISARVDEATLTLEWRERGGPRIENEPAHRGFGTELVDLSIAGQLDGTIERQWLPEGLHMTMRVARHHLRRA